jgi:hypothetical protein
MARKKAVEIIQTELTERQQLFVEQLLTGKTITEAANEVGISRRAATYWLHSDDHLVRLEYDRLRLMAKDAFRQRIANLHDLALKALEDVLAEDAPPGIRFAAAKFLYEAHLRDVGGMNTPYEPEKLVKQEVHEVKEKAYLEQFDGHYMDCIPS